MSDRGQRTNSCNRQTLLVTDHYDEKGDGVESIQGGKINLKTLARQAKLMNEKKSTFVTILIITRSFFFISSPGGHTAKECNKFEALKYFLNQIWLIPSLTIIIVYSTEKQLRNLTKACPVQEKVFAQLKYEKKYASQNPSPIIFNCFCFTLSAL